MQSTWLEWEESWQMVFASNSQVRHSCEIPSKHSILLFCHMCSIMSSPPLFIPSLPTYWKECFSKRKTWKLPLRVRDFYTYNHLHNPLWFSPTPASPYPYPWEIDRPNIYHTQSECKVRFWCNWEALEEAYHLADAIRLNCMIRRAREEKVSSIQLVAGAWKAQVHGVK